MNILITGGSGYIGKKLIDYLSKRKFINILLLKLLLEELERTFVLLLLLVKLCQSVMPIILLLPMRDTPGKD